MEQTTNCNTLFSVVIDINHDDVNKTINFTGLNEQQSLDVCEGLEGALTHQLQWATEIFLQKVRKGDCQIFGKMGIYYMDNGKIVLDESFIKKSQ
jgi:hypothetical protein